MAAIKLPRLPDRSQVKLTIVMSPELKHVLDDYATFYRQSYGEEEAVVDLIPAMLAQFLASDRTFSKAREALRSASDGQAG
jgi:hypothetical protein